MQFHKRLATLTCLSILLPLGLNAELTLPPSSNAGIIDKEILRDYDVETLSPTKQIPMLEVDIPEKTLQIPDGISAQVDKVQFIGVTAFSDAKLQAVVKPFLGRSLNGRDLKDLCRAVQKYYAENGYILAQVFPPMQEMDSEHVLKVEVIEGFLGDVTIEGNRYYSDKFIRKFFASQVGKAVNYNDILRSLLLLNENMDLSVGSVFKKGKNRGEADLVIIAKDKLPLHFYSDYNNYGSRITTNDRIGGTVEGGNLITSGDKLSFLEVVGFPPSDLNFSNVVYSIPLNGNGAKLNLSYLFSHFQVGTLRPLDLAGQSNIGGLRVNQALKRTRVYSSDISFGFDFKQFKNERLGYTYSYDKLRVLVLNGAIDFIDSFKGRTITNMTLSAGIPNFLGGLHAIDERCSRPGAGGRFFIGNVDLRRLQKLPWDCLLIFSASGQGTWNKLPISQQIYIGGADTVRGYPLASALGDNGYFGTLEFRAPIPYLADKKLFFSKTRKWKDFFQFVAFTDTGGVFLNGHVSGEGAPSYLTAMGVGLRVYGLWRFDISFDSGFPLTKDYKSSDSIQYVKVGLKIL